jgi:type VI secretion system protein ImpB
MVPPLRDRKFVDISHENFNAVLEKAAPYLNFRVADKLSGKDGGTIGVELNFKTFEDFDPARVAEKIPELNKLLEMRHKLAQLKANMAGNHKLEEMLADIIQNTEKATELAKAMGPQDKPEGTTNG